MYQLLISFLLIILFEIKITLNHKCFLLFWIQKNYIFDYSINWLSFCHGITFLGRDRQFVTHGDKIVDTFNIIFQIDPCSRLSWSFTLSTGNVSIVVHYLVYFFGFCRELWSFFFPNCIWLKQFNVECYWYV